MTNIGSILVSTPMGNIEVCASDLGLISIKFFEEGFSNQCDSREMFSRKVNFDSIPVVFKIVIHEITGKERNCITFANI